MNLQTRDPSSPDFWSERFEQNFTPWDRGAVPQALRDYVAREPQPRHVLIPGCGVGHEVAYSVRGRMGGQRDRFFRRRGGRRARGAGAVGRARAASRFLHLPAGRAAADDLRARLPVRTAAPHVAGTGGALGRVAAAGRLVGRFFLLRRGAQGAAVRRHAGAVGRRCWNPPSCASRTPRWTIRSCRFATRNAGRCGAGASPGADIVRKRLCRL